MQPGAARVGPQPGAGHRAQADGQHEEGAPCLIFQIYFQNQ